MLRRIDNSTVLLYTTFHMTQCAVFGVLYIRAFGVNRWSVRICEVVDLFLPSKFQGLERVQKDAVGN